jgi:hypothetical protein
MITPSTIKSLSEVQFPWSNDFDLQVQYDFDDDQIVVYGVQILLPNPTTQVRDIEVPSLVAFDELQKLGLLDLNHDTTFKFDRILYDLLNERGLL